MRKTMGSRKSKRKSSPKDKWGLTKSEWSTLKGFRLHHKTRYFARTVMVILFLYCLVVGATSLYYAYELFSGGEISGEIGKLDTQVKIEKYSQTYIDKLKPIVEKVDFFKIGWTAILHTILLFYIAFRAFVRLRRWRLQTPRAKLVLKLAARLERLGQLNVKEKTPLIKPSKKKK